MVVVVLLLLVALFAPWIAPHPPNQTNSAAFLQPPAWQAGGSWAYLLGTDAIGRDILSRLIYGARLSLSIGVAVVAISIVVGIALGLIAGFFRGVARDRDHAADGHHPHAAEPAAGDRDRRHPRARA